MISKGREIAFQHDADCNQPENLISSLLSYFIACHWMLELIEEMLLELIEEMLPIAPCLYVTICVRASYQDLGLQDIHT